MPLPLTRRAHSDPAPREITPMPGGTAVSVLDRPGPDPAVHDDLTRRRFLGGLTAIGLLAGCASPQAAPPPAARDGFPRTVLHDQGTTEIPARPQRVYVSGTAGILDCLLCLDVLPVVLGKFAAPLQPWQQAAAGIPTVDAYEPDVEQLAAQRPDLGLINTYLWDQPVAEQVRALAPSVVLPASGQVPAILDLYGRALGLEERARAVAAQWDAAIAGFTAPPGLTVTVVRGGFDGQPYVFTPSEIGIGRFLADLGVTLKPLAAPDGANGFALSQENYGLLDADRIIGLGDGPETARGLDDVERSPLFQAIPAVREGRYRRPAETDAQAILAASPLCLDRALAALAAALS